MGLLVPLYLAGLAALSLPLVLHLVRRVPRGRQSFSSLMFLSPSPPRLTRRSRLDQLLLLTLRLTALALVALAFCRPFLRESATLSLADVPGRKVAILIDSSASMQREDLWQQAIRKAEQELDELNPQDDVALFEFSDRLRTVVDFEKQGVEASSGKTQLVRQRLRALEPGWGGTDLGAALVAVAAGIDLPGKTDSLPLEPQIAVISDFQKGSRIEALGTSEWPRRVRVIARQVSPARHTNAFAHVLPSDEDADVTDIRVRVVNAADSSGEQFYVNWASASVKLDQEREIAVYVPGGQSRVVRLPRSADSLRADRILLRGDDHEFDNTFYVVPPRKQSATVDYIGNDAANDPQGLQYYLRLAVANDPLRQVEVRVLDAASPLPPSNEDVSQLAVVSTPLAPELQTRLRTRVERGMLLVFVTKDHETALSIPFFFDDVKLGGAPTPNDGEYQLLGQIDYAHPLFAPYANPRYSDFTKIHFWRHQQVVLDAPATTTVIARFDNGDPALFERTIGKGRVLVLTSGWQPDESQLALSSKFVPFIGGILDRACGSTEAAANVAVHEPVVLADVKAGSSATVWLPSGREIGLATEEKVFLQTDLPGVYRATAGTGETRFAVNLAASESNTAPLEIEQLEQRGVRFGGQPSRAERLERLRQARDTELENRQKVWRGLIAAALGVLVIETWLGGRAERKIKAAPVSYEGELR